MSEVNTAPPPVVAPPAAAPVTPPSSGISKPWASEWIQADYSLNHTALDRMPEHLKGLRPTLERQKNFEDVLTVLQHSQVLNGKKALAPLPPDSPQPVIAERKTLLDTINGVPPSAKDYGITRPQDFPETQWNQPLADGFAQWAHENSVSPTAAKKLIAIQMEAVKGQLGEQQKYEQQFYVDQDKAFASALQLQGIPADRAASLIEKGALSLGLDLNNEGTKQFMKGSDARLMAMKHAIATGEDRAIPEGGGSQGADADPAGLAKQATTDPANPLYGPYWNKEGKYSRAAQEAAIAKVNGWYQQAAGKPKK